MWAPQIPALGRDAAVVAPNLPGFGGASGAGSVMEMSEGADAVAKAARQAGVTRALVCGLSMGGYVALALWRQYPELIAGFVFANTKATADDEAAQDRRRQLAARLHSEGSRFLVASPPPLLSEDAHPALWGLVKNVISAQPPESIAAASRGMADRPDSTPDLATIRVPTLVITGSKDTLIPPDATKPMAEGVGGARYEVIEGAGHLTNLEAPERFNALLLEHWARVRAL
jgi:pimeloyl-ACP methyl ester carboxylesterase